jgi:hypothetical protein
MIKLVVSDIDGTLVPEGTDQINPEIFEIIRELKKKGIIFVAASGRQYASMRYLFEPVADDIIFIAENGSNVMCRERSMSTSYMDPELAEELLQCLRAQEDSEIILSVPENLYMECKEDWFRNKLEEGYHNKVKRVEDLLPYCRKTNKISVFRAYDIDELAAQLKEKFGDRLNVAIAGSVWVDLMNKDVDKGNALATIQQLMKIGTDETMAFGDNCNDLGMLRQAGESYAVTNAHPQLKAVAKHIAPKQNEDGVLTTIKNVLL